MDEIIKSQNESKFFALLKAAMSVPGVKIDRTEYLRRELSKYFKTEIVDLAVERNPAEAGISVSNIEKIARSSINHETNQVSLISVAAGIPGGFAMIGTVPADTVQYFAHLVRILQKLIYLYGWSELYNSDGEFDDETSDRLTLFIGVMFGVNAANAAVARIAQKTAIKVESTLANKALTRGVVYPIVKKVAELLGYKMTKEIFAKGVSKFVPIAGGVLSGGLTYATFKPAALNLKKHLKKLPLADIDFYSTSHNETAEIDFSDIIDME